MTQAEHVKITLKVKDPYPGRSTEADRAYVVYQAVEHAIRWGNPAGKHLSDTAVRNMVDAVVSTLGLDFDSEFGRRAPVPVVDPMRGIKAAIRRLVNFAPEGGYIPELAKAGFEHDNVGFFGSEEEYREYLDKTPPLFADPVIYAVLASGKHDGRTVKGMVRELCDAAGLELKDSGDET